MSFLLPLRDWKNHPVVKQLPESDQKDVSARIDKATREFIEFVNPLIQVGPIDRATNEKIQIAVALWGHEVRLAQYFDAFRSRTLAATGSRGPPKLDQLPFVRSVKTVPAAPKDPLVLDEIRLERMKFSSGRSYLRYEMPPDKRPSIEVYTRFMDNTVEPIHQTGGEFGHFSLRVGRRLYSFNYLQDTSRNKFSIGMVGHGKTGFVFQADPEKIRGAQDELEKIYKNSEDNNVPPFDEYSAMLEIVRHEDGSMNFRSNSPSGANNRSISAELVEEEGKHILLTGDGFKYPVIQQGDKLYVQSLSCASSATYVMKKYFGIDVAFTPGAKSLRDTLGKGNPGRQAPDAIVYY